MLRMYLAGHPALARGEVGVEAGKTMVCNKKTCLEV